MSALPPGLLIRDNDTYIGANSLLAFLREHNALPYTEESVEAYKAAQIQKAAPRFWERERFLVGMFRVLNDLVIIGILGSVFLALAAIGCVVFEHDDPFGRVMTISVVLVVFMGLTALCLWSGIVWSKLELIKDPAKWYMDPYQEGDAPTKIDRLALMIARRFRRKARVYRDALYQNFRTLDPFLVVRYKNRDYYIAVWDESSFSD